MCCAQTFRHTTFDRFLPNLLFERLILGRIACITCIRPTRRTVRVLCDNHAAHGWIAKRLSRLRAGLASRLSSVQGIMHVFDGTAHWCHLANTIKRSMHGGDAALRQITLTTCSLLYISRTNTVSRTESVIGL